MENGNKPAGTILDPNGSYYETGLTKREYFAGLAMQGLLVHTLESGLRSTEDYATKAVKLADELLKALEG